MLFVVSEPFALELSPSCVRPSYRLSTMLMPQGVLSHVTHTHTRRLEEVEGVLPLLYGLRVRTALLLLHRYSPGMPRELVWGIMQMALVRVF
jgi:hypothetical protein